MAVDLSSTEGLDKAIQAINAINTVTESTANIKNRYGDGAAGDGGTGATGRMDGVHAVLSVNADWEAHGGFTGTPTSTT